MDPISIALGVAGLGMNLMGGLGQSNISSQMAGLSRANAGIQLQQEGVRRTYMEMVNRRSQVEQVRNAQRMRSQALSASVSDGAQYGSGVQGGMYGVTAQGAFNTQGLRNSLQLGEQNFDLNSQIDANRMQMSSLGSSAAMYQGLSGFGGAMFGASTKIGNMFQGMWPTGGGGGAQYNGLSWT